MGACDTSSIVSKRSSNLPHEPPPSPKRLKTEIDARDEKSTHYTDEEEEERLNEEIRNNEGVDIDFSKYSYTYGRLPVDLDGQLFGKEPETNRDFIGRLSMEALNHYNEENGMELQFGKVVKANWGGAAGYIFYVTIEVTDTSSSDNQPLLYQAKIRHFSNIETEFIFCRPRPCQED